MFLLCAIIVLLSIYCLNWEFGFDSFELFALYLALREWIDFVRERLLSLFFYINVVNYIITCWIPFISCLIKSISSFILLIFVSKASMEFEINFIILIYNIIELPIISYQIVFIFTILVLFSFYLWENYFLNWFIHSFAVVRFIHRK